MLNRYFEVATAAILAEGGTVVQFVGDAMMALFNAPARQPDHPVRAARAALALQARVEAVAAARRAGRASGSASTPAPRWSATSAAPRCATSTRWATRSTWRPGWRPAAQPGQVVIGESTRARLPAGRGRRAARRAGGQGPPQRGGGVPAVSSADRLQLGTPRPLTGGRLCVEVPVRSRYRTVGRRRSARQASVP